MTVLGCKWHPRADNVGVCAHCLRESLSRLAVYQDEEDDSIDLEIFPPSMPSSGMPTGSNRRAQQFMLVQYQAEDDGSRGGLAGDNSDMFYPGVNRNGLAGGNNNNQQHDHEPTDVHDHADMLQGEASTSEDSGSGGGQDEVPPARGAHPGESESGHSNNKRKLGRPRKPKSWGSAMMKMVGFRTFSVLWRSEKTKAEASSLSSQANNNKPHDHGGFEDSGAHQQQLTPTQLSVTSALEQTMTMTPHRYSVSSQWEQQTTPARYHEQITPSRYSGASLFDIESMDSRRFSTSSRGSPFTGGRPGVINGENFNAAWRASKSGAHGRNQMAVFEDAGSKGVVVAHDNAPGKSPAKSPAKTPMKSPWKWFSSFKSGATSSQQQQKPSEPIPAASVSPYQERRKSTSSMPVGNPKARDSRQPLTPVLTSKKSPWWKSSPAPRIPRKSPLMLPAKAGHRDQEVATDSQDDTPHRLSSASPMVGYSRSSSNGSSCFTTPRWNNNNHRTRSQHGTRGGMAAHEREHEISHLAI